MPRGNPRRAAPDGHKWCKLCEQFKPFDAFYRNRTTWNGCSSYCKPCTDKYNKENQHKYTEQAQQYHRLWNVKRMYGLSADEYQRLWDKTHGRCYICGNEETTKHRSGTVHHIAVDHDHESGRVRGLLCRKCNSAIGHANHDVELLRKMIKYLENT